MTQTWPGPSRNFWNEFRPRPPSSWPALLPTPPIRLKAATDSSKHIEIWVSRCAQSLRQASQEKGIDFLGYYGCQGAPSPPIEQFIHNNIVADEEEWREYIQEARQHPDEDDLRTAREFAQAVLVRF